MKYKIYTAPIWDAFKTNGCPLCGISEDISGKLVHQFSNDAVMEPLYRVELNKNGLCKEHACAINLQSKLSAALQLATRTDYLHSLLTPPTKKLAARAGAEIEQQADSCLVCKKTYSALEQYAETINLMYQNEADFPPLLRQCKGFCMQHFGLLVRYARDEAYLADLYKVQRAALAVLSASLGAFVQLYDYKKTASPTNEVKEAVNETIKKVCK